MLAARLDMLEGGWPGLVRPEQFEERGALHQLADLLSGLEHPRWVEVAELSLSEFPTAWEEKHAWRGWHLAWRYETIRRRDDPVRALLVSFLARREL